MEKVTTAGFKLSVQQERVWLQQGDRAAFDASCEMVLRGALEKERLRTALQSVIDRHEILRTVFHHQPGIKLPFQVIQEHAPVAWEESDSDHEPETPESAGAGQASSLDKTGFENGPSLQAKLVEIRPDYHLLRLRASSLLVDAKSLRLIVAEMGNAYVGDTSRSQSESLLQYADFVEWQSELLRGEDTRAGREYWRDHFRKLDFSAQVSLPLEAKKAADEFAPTVLSIKVDPSLCTRVEELTAATNQDIPDVFGVAWQALLSRLSGSPEVLLGYEVDGRKYEELETAVGPFAQMLPISVVTGPGETFRTLLRRAKEILEDARKWEESFSWASLEGSAGDAFGPMLPLQFAFVDLEPQSEFGGLSFEITQLQTCAARYKLKLVVVKNDKGFSLHFCYDGSRISLESVKIWADSYRVLLAAALQQPDAPVALLPVLGEGERGLLLRDWNQTTRRYPHQCFQQLFEAQVSCTPDRTAMRVGEATLSYAQLNERANRLAHYLRGQGVGPNSRVALSVDRSAEMMVALLGILKAGGAYVPLNADNPKARLTQQLEGVKVLVTEQKLLAKMPDFAGSTISVDQDQALWTQQPTSNPSVETTPEDLIYVIYTSGSTGVPKGVAVRHRNLVNYARFMVERLGLNAYPDGLHFATVSTIGADLGNTCIFPALLSGGCLHVIRYEDSTDSRRFSEYNRRFPIDVLKIVPSHLQALLNSGEGMQILPRRFLIMGGEMLTARLLDKIALGGASCEILNHYGPTETTVGSLTLRLNEFDWKNSISASVPIGRPIANTQVYILDLHMEPVPIGVAGELYIAGEGVTAGYLDQPEKTAERFVFNPFSEDRNTKMYRTGDLARYLADGNVEFLGRSDDQIKIRGFRVELGEIDSALLALPGVKQAAVIAIEEKESLEKRLAAYVVVERNIVSDGQVLTKALRDHLPEYMMPASVILLDKFPLNQNGKIDRKALPKPDEWAGRQKSYIPPTSPTEQITANVWSEVLRVEKVGRTDDFFELGGHSLLATQVVSRMRRALNIELPLRALFEYTMVAELSQYIDEQRRGIEDLDLPAIQPIPRGQRLPLSFAQQRLWILDQLEPNSPLYNISRPIRLRGVVNVDALQKSLDQIVARHEALRTTFHIIDGQAAQAIRPPTPLSIAIEDLQNVPEGGREAELRNRVTRESELPFNLSQGPLLRVKLFRLATEDHLLLFVMHHIVSDAWSAAVFQQELSGFYNSFASGGSISLPELTIQYADYANWQRQWLQGRVLESQLSFWREQFRGVPPLLNLPTDRPRPEVRSPEGGHEAVVVPTELFEQLQALSRDNGVTLFMTLFAVFQILLARYSGQKEIVVGTDVANRPNVETERLIGFFINLLPLRASLAGNPTFRALLSRVRESTLAAYAHQEMPFDKLVEELRPERSLSYNPLVQVLFVMQNTPRVAKEFAGLKVSRFELPVRHSKFDVAVFAAESDGDLAFHWIYSSELFERSTILTMAKHFKNLLRAAAANPESRVEALEMLSAEEQARVSQEKRQRKQAQMKKLVVAEPKSVSLSDGKLKSD